MVQHPIDIGKMVEAKQPTCPCTGSSFKLVSGKIEKIIPNKGTYWYYLNIGITVSAANITKVN